MDPFEAHLEAISGLQGPRLFQELVLRLTQILGTHGAWVTEYDESSRKLKALAFRLGDAWIKDYTYSVAGTRCQPAIEGPELVHVPRGLVERFPSDPELRKLGAVSYLGIACRDGQGRVLGHLATLDTRPMPLDDRNRARFRILADRAAAELSRLRGEERLVELQQQREQLLDASTDAILELDDELQLRGVNPAAQKLLDCWAEQALGRSIDELAATDSVDRLREAIAAGERWLPGGLRLRTPAGQEIQVDGTLLRCRQDRRNRHTLILRRTDQDRILTRDEMNELEKHNLIRALEACRWRVSGPSGAARRLGMNASTLSSRMRALEIRKPAAPVARS